MLWKTVTPSSSMPGRDQRGRPDQPHLGAERQQREDVGPRDAAMGHVAANGHGQALERAFVAADGQRVQQGLRRMFVRAVASVDHRSGHFAGQQGRGAGLIVPHHQEIALHGVQRGGRIHQRLAFVH